MKNLWAITCYFNPVGYRRRLQNYFAFRSRLNVPLITVELTYGTDFDLPDDDAGTMIRVRSNDILWQKERLLNLALAKLPASCDAVAWLDCHIVFEDDDWADRAARELERTPLLQPFRRVFEPSPDGWLETERVPDDACSGRSLAHMMSMGLVTPELLRGNMRMKQKGNSGLAWVARREIIDRDGFYDACIMGSGNRAMLCAALGTPADAIDYLRMTPSWARHYEAWADRHLRHVRGDIGSIDGTLVHLWHGDLADRRYQARHHEFGAFGFDPQTDIALDENDCWRWSSDKHDMHRCVARYFRERREDGVETMRAVAAD